MTTSSVLDMLERQQFRCALSGRALTPECAALDHIVPVRCGGEHVIENTQVLHKDVNRAKASSTNAEFVAMCGEVVQWSARGGPVAGEAVGPRGDVSAAGGRDHAASAHLATGANVGGDKPATGAADSLPRHPTTSTRRTAQ